VFWRLKDYFVETKTNFFNRRFYAVTGAIELTINNITNENKFCIVP
jgi:hypothetical protein